MRLASSLGGSVNSKFLFTGSVWPPIPDGVFVNPIAVSVSSPFFPAGIKATVAFVQEEVSVSCELEEPVHDLYTLRNVAQVISQDILNCFSCSTGQFFRLELRHVTLSDGKLLYFGHIQELINLHKALELPDSNRIFELHMKNQALLPALRDLQGAVYLPDETPFLCFRAIERIREALKTGNEKTKGEAWKTMHRKLRTSEEQFNRVTELAESNRHGENPLLTWTDRRDCLGLTLDILRRFIRFVENADS